MVDISVPRSEYALLRILLSGANGNSRISLTIAYEDSTEEHLQLSCPDWYDDGWTQSGPPYVTPLINGMDRLTNGSFDNASDPALFEVVVRPTKPTPIERLRLSPADSQFDNPRTTANILAITGVGAVAVEN